MAGRSVRRLDPEEAEGLVDRPVGHAEYHELFVMSTHLMPPSHPSRCGSGSITAQDRSYGHAVQAEIRELLSDVPIWGRQTESPAR